MLNICYDPWGTKEEWRMRYVVHPDFDVSENVLVVEQGGQWAGGGAAWFRELILKNNNRIKVYSAGDLYVHPDHRGRGVYSAAMQGLNRLAAERGAILGFAFPSVYRLPATALPRYGFVEVFYPSTYVLVLNPRRFFEFLVARAKTALVPERFDGITFKLTVRFNTSKGQSEITGLFKIEAGKIDELTEGRAVKSVDLTVKVEAGVLLRIMSSFYLRKKLILLIAANWMKGSLKVRPSLRLVRTLLRV
jgi:GNAT superfamily N-acetyltransferase